MRYDYITEDGKTITQDTQTSRVKPLWKLSDAELEAIANSDSDDQDAAIQELDARVRERTENPHDDTPCIDWGGWDRPGDY